MLPDSRLFAVSRPQEGQETSVVFSYIKSNVIVGRHFASWSELEAHLEAGTRDVADVRVHGTTGETPIAQVARDDASALRPLAGTPPFISPAICRGGLAPIAPSRGMATPTRCHDG